MDFWNQPQLTLTFITTKNTVKLRQKNRSKLMEIKKNNQIKQYT